MKVRSRSLQYQCVVQDARTAELHVVCGSAERLMVRQNFVVINRVVGFAATDETLHCKKAQSFGKVGCLGKDDFKALAAWFRSIKIPAVVLSFEPNR